MAAKIKTLLPWLVCLTLVAGAAYHDYGPAVAMPDWVPSIFQRASGPGRVLIVYDTDAALTWPIERKEIRTSIPIRDWAKTHCITTEEPDGMLLIGKSTDPSKLPEVWRPAFDQVVKWQSANAGKDAVCYFVGSRARIEELPGDEAATLKFLQSVGGK